MELLYSVSTYESTVYYTFTQDYSKIIAVASIYRQASATPNMTITTEEGISLINEAKLGQLSGRGSSGARIIVYENIKAGDKVSAEGSYGTFFVLGIS